MIGKILIGIINLIVSLVSLILTPIDNLITSSLPNLANGLISVGAWLNIATQSIGWVISLTGISSDVISMIILYYGFKLTIPLLFYFIKLALQWYDKLKP